MGMNIAFEIVVVDERVSTFVVVGSEWARL